ncbi:ATP-binding cassette domain-containing protein [Rhizobium sp. P40RR-XXII]|uniref:ATP-binding cassette domain-containing protein n=1 Tax=Rhizobium sp. P40RR-XXII TaxID=2726739 RepID=UPI00145635E1|nr:ATP-binding cassette domain-containing protein [Rhizobium sp. P40RR-XXII]NLS20431.1 ATP-binding cassette domain-containing protein [Rhizobium sp. P40RR-XXII]
MSKDKASAAKPECAHRGADKTDMLALARHGANGSLRTVFTLQVTRLVLRLGFSAVTAVIAGRLVMEQRVDLWLPILAVGLLTSSAIAGLFGDRTQAKAEATIAAGLRDAAKTRLDAMSPRQLNQLPIGTLVIATQRYPEAVASLVIGHRMASWMMAVGPLLAATMLLLVSWQAAVLIICLTPVMIMFFALVGDAIRSRAAVQERAFGRLAGQFADRIRALPTILANHALVEQEKKLSARLETYAHETMGVLTIAFINAGIIDFFASLSIALLAVFLGLGHLKLMMIPGFFNLALWQSLFILMIAPDYFAPFRRFSEQYHAKAEGLAAANALERLLNVEVPEAVVVSTLSRSLPPLPEHGLVAIVGPSGCGKSTLLRRLCGLDPTASPARSISGEIAWVSTDGFVAGHTLGEAILWGLPPVSPTRLLDAASAVALLDDALLPGGLGAPLARGGGNLSGGQRLRILVARSILSGKVVVADEPTAKLDTTTSALVRHALLEIARSRLVVVATHDKELASSAWLTIDLSNDENIEVAA